MCVKAHSVVDMRGLHVFFPNSTIETGVECGVDFDERDGLGKTELAVFVCCEEARAQ
jgi:hypothetical protein